MGKKELSFIEYNSSLKDEARFLRKHQTPAEMILWDKVLRKDQLWYRFLRQKLISGFIADFYCSKLKLVIEIDGDIHLNQIEYDNERSQVLEKLGIFVIRFTNQEIQNSLPAIIDELKKVITEREDILWL